MVARTVTGGGAEVGSGALKTTRYFEESLLERPEIRREWCERAVRQPLEVRQQGNGWFQHWAYVPEAGKYLRVITLEDGETLHNAFFDRGYGRRP
jgi:hypothetical protein